MSGSEAIFMGGGGGAGGARPQFYPGLPRIYCIRMISISKQSLW